MKIIYIFKNNDYAAILAAYLHLKMNIPSNFEDIPMKRPLEKMKLYYIGADEEFRKVYLLKYGMKKNILMNILQGMGNIFNEGIKVIELERFDGFINHIRFKNNLKICRKELEDYIHENNL